MGLKDHLGHDPGHLYVESTDPHLSTSVPWSMVEKPTMDKVNSHLNHNRAIQKTIWGNNLELNFEIIVNTKM